MFTGLIETTGTLLQKSGDGRSCRLSLEAPTLAGDMEIGDSLAVNGCCLTVAEMEGELLSFDCLEETMNRTNLGFVQPGDILNLERPLRADSRLGGHFVQGHIDTTGVVTESRPSGTDCFLRVEYPTDYSQLVVSKGSIAINGASLTVVDTRPGELSVWLIPVTQRMTNLGRLRSGDRVNLEFDILAKYVQARLPVA